MPNVHIKIRQWYRAIVTVLIIMVEKFIAPIIDFFIEPPGEFLYQKDFRI